MPNGTPPAYTEEQFGVLTDDGLYLDCVLVRPPDLRDEDLTGLRVWVPKLPLTKVSVLACARKEVLGAGANSRIGHLAFDLRGTGESDFRDAHYDHDLKAIRLWAEERFGQVEVRYYGTPTLSRGRVFQLPLRPNVLLEHYLIDAAGEPTRRCLLYLATYGNFNLPDEAICWELAQAGFHVVAVDPWRYLLHASLGERLTPGVLLDDFRLFMETFPGPPIVISQPTAGGLGLLWAAGTPEVRGAIVIGRAQVGLRAPHIFDNGNPHTFFTGRFAARLSPRPLALVLDGRARREDADELAALYQASLPPHRLEKVKRVDAEFLGQLVAWIDSGGA